MNLTMTNRQGKHLFVTQHSVENTPVMVFSNSLGTDQGMWQAQIEALANKYHIITYDTRGHGKSDVIAETKVQNLAEDVVDILDQLNIQKAHFCGISMGGMTALYLGVNYTDRFHSITVANSAAKIWTEDGWNTRADAVSEQGLADLVASTHTRWFSEHFDYQNDELAQRTIQSLADMPALGYAASCRALAKVDLREEIQKISIPTLIIAGLYDPVTTVADGEFMQQKIASAQLYVIEASHLSNIEQPEQFNFALNSFIQSVQ